MITWRLGAAILLLNAALSVLVQMAAPSEPRLSDREEYEFNSLEPFAPNCPKTIYCYRFLVPAVLARVPLDSNARWRGLQWLAHTATGTIIGLAVTPYASPFIASTLLQTSYAFSFTAYDPFTPDPVVFLIAALLLYWWMRDRPIAVAVMVLIGVFVKETAGVLAACAATAAWFAPERPRRWRWLVPVIVAAIALFAFHWYMDTYRGWSMSKNPAANFSGGSWLALWWRNNPSIVRKALMLFAPFGWAWMFAALGYRIAPAAIRQLAVGAIFPIAALMYLQTPERALGNAFFVIVPLAAVFLSRLSPAVAWAAAISNSLVTVKIGLSTALLPSTSILLLPASVAAVWAVASSRRESA